MLCSRDSRRTAAGENNSYWRNLYENMKENALDPHEVPVVIQYNKRDLPDTKTDAEIDETRRKGREPVIGAVAIRGEGVLETLYTVLTMAYRNLEARAALSKNIGLTEAEFLGQVFNSIDVSGTALEKRFGAAKKSETGDGTGNGRAGAPVYKHVTTPTPGRDSAATTWASQSGLTAMSLSDSTRVRYRAAGSMLIRLEILPLLPWRAGSVTITVSRPGYFA